jgi:hypothetical protein
MADDMEAKRQHYLGIGIALGAGIGTALGIVFDNLAIGISLGAGLGLVLGSIMGTQRGDKSQQRTPSDDRGDA